MTPQSLFTAHRDSVFRYLVRIVGPSEASDLTQEVFLRVTRAGAPETTEDRQRAWIFTIARNLALNCLRDRGRRPETVNLDDAGQAPSQDTAVAMRQALDRLPIVDRDVFLLREVVGLSYEEIAVCCEMTVEAVRARLRRARVQLRTTLGPLLLNGSTPSVRLYEP